MLPLVSVLTPTYNRPALLARAALIFQAYRYERREWIVVDDSPEPFRGELGKGVRYVHLASKTNLGRKHNIAAGMAQGEILVHRDDDDLFGPMSLTRQVEAIFVDGVDIAGFRMNFIRDDRTGDFYHFRRNAKWTRTDPTTAPIFTFHDSNGGYHRRVLAAGLQYTNAPVAQKVHFLNDAIRAGFTWRTLENDGHFVYSRHGKNTWQFAPANMVRAEIPGFAAFGWLKDILRRSA